MDILSTLLIGLVVLLLLLITSFIGHIISALAGASFVSSRKKIVTAMIELANIKPHDRVVDLGSGDGRLVFAAAKTGAVAIGYEISWPVWLQSKLTQIIGRHKGKLVRANIFTVSLAEANVVFCYLLPPVMAALKPKLEQDLPPGARVISHAFPVPGWPVSDRQGKVFLQYRP